MSDFNRSFIVVPGGHELNTFVKTITLRNGGSTYTDPVKQAIVVQFNTLLRDESYNQTRAIRTLAKLHDVVPSTIAKWARQFGSDLVTPVKPRLAKEKPVKPVKQLTASNEDIVKTLQSVSKTSSETPFDLNSIVALLNSLPCMDITISIRPNKD